MKEKSYKHFRTGLLTFLIVIFMSVFAFADVQTLESMGLQGYPLVPDYYNDYLYIPSFANLEYSDTISGLSIDVPTNLTLSYPATFSNNYLFLNPIIVYNLGAFSIMANPQYNYQNYQNSYQSIGSSFCPTFNINQNLAVGLEGSIYNNNSYIFANVGFNGAVKFGNTIMGFSLQNQVLNWWNQNISFSFWNNPNAEFLLQSAFSNGNKLRVFDNFNSYGGGYNNSLNLSYFNSDSQNMTGIALMNSFEEDNWYSNNNSMELSYLSFTLDPFIQKTIGNFSIHAGLPLSVNYNNPEYNPSYNGTHINFGSSYGVSCISPLGSFNLYYVGSNFTLFPTEGQFNLGFSYNKNF